MPEAAWDCCSNAASRYLRAMHKLAPLALSALLAACSGTQKKNDEIEQDPIEFEDPPDADGGGAAQAAGHLTVVPMKISDGQAVIFIKEDGTIEAQGKTVGSVNVKGEILAPNGGLFATLKPDGSIEQAHIKGKFLDGLLITKEGLFKKQDKELVAISEDGTVSANGTNFIKLEGPAEGRQAAMFVLAIAVMANAELPEPTENPCGNGDANPCGGDSANPCGN